MPLRSRLRGRIGAPTRNVNIGALQDTFLISAVAMILIIRLQLFLTHYPQLGDGRLHIAHLLWGGLFMLIAIGILISFVGPGLRLPAAIVAGVGFGFFIDELGKFITDDNDYFFEPRGRAHLPGVRRPLSGDARDAEPAGAVPA